MVRNNYQPIKSLFQFIFSFAPYASRARIHGPQVDAFLMQTEVWAIIVLLSFQDEIFKFNISAETLGPRTSRSTRLKISELRNSISERETLFYVWTQTY